MTAHVMKGDRERCLAAGCDDYLSKPMRGKNLADALARCAARDRRPGASPVGESATAEVPVSPGFDLAFALEAADGDEEFLRELAGVFLEDIPRLLAELRAAARAGDPERLSRAAHAIKGSVANFGAPGAVATAQRLETMGCAATGPIVAELESLVAALTSGLAGLVSVPVG